MKNAQVIKTKENQPSADELRKINTYTRREFGLDEVYVFSVVLCDNDVDRDFERFTVEALFEMEKLFVGKTGICDHTPKAENQKARIFECFVEAVEGKKTLTGDDYFRLVARAYMPKTRENEQLILNIDSGITKEVSVGLAASQSACSVCGEKRGRCSHIRGEIYSDILCYFELSGVTDAYEWSFVAVPSQREAGVIKSYILNNGKDKAMKNILKNLSLGEGMTLEGEDCRVLANYIERLEKRALQGEDYREELVKEFKRLSAVYMPEVSEKTMDTVADALEVSGLKELCKAFEEKAKEKFGTDCVQTKKNPANKGQDNKDYSI